jgi:hypothetical protein
MKAMLLSKLKFVTALVLMVVFASLSTVWFFDQARGNQPLGLWTEPEPAAEDPPPIVVKVIVKEVAPEEDRIIGSGKPATKEIQVSDFTTVAAGSSFQVEITKGDSFRTVLTADDNLIDHVKAVKEGSALSLTMDPEIKSWTTKERLKATITMPALEGITLSGATVGTINGFESGKDFKGRISGASSLSGTLKAGKMDLHATGASSLTLQGSAKDATLSADGASRLRLGELTLDSAVVTLSGASSATVNTKTALDYRLSGASHLTYHGNPTIGKSQKTGASSVSHK